MNREAHNRKQNMKYIKSMYRINEYIYIDTHIDKYRYILHMYIYTYVNIERYE